MMSSEPHPQAGPVTRGQSGESYMHRPAPFAARRSLHHLTRTRQPISRSMVTFFRDSGRAALMIAATAAAIVRHFGSQRVVAALLLGTLELDAALRRAAEKRPLPSPQRSEGLNAAAAASSFGFSRISE